MRRSYTLSLGNQEIRLGAKTLIMGILNITPDSFSDGGKYVNEGDALIHALEMIDDGADIIDIGGESTRPGAKAISTAHELDRIIPIIEAIRKKSAIPISIDTYKSEVAKVAFSAGANIINDISGCRFDPKMPELAADLGCPTIIMHIKGTPKDMQTNPTYEDLIMEIQDYLRASIEMLTTAGLRKEQIIIDPGIGFGKTTEDNLCIMNHLDEFEKLDQPILMGVSRKSVIGNVLNRPANERLLGTAAATAVNIMKGAHIIRIHDVHEMKDVAKMTDAIVNARHTG